MKDERRTHSAHVARLLTGEKSTVWAIPLCSILLSLLVASLVLLGMGRNPLTAIYSFLQGSGWLPKESYGNGLGMLTDLFSFLNVLSPMILAALSFVVGLKAGLFNIGIAGQMLFAGVLATATVGYLDIPAAVAKPLVLIIGLFGGMALGAFVGLLKYKLNINEVVSTILLNYIISNALGFVINTHYLDPINRSMKVCSSAARLAWTNVSLGETQVTISLGVFIAILAAILVKFIYDKTVLGFELKAVGSNIRCAKYAGIQTNKRIMYSMVFSGALAGLAGVTYYLGYTNRIIPKELSSIGYDAIAAAMLGGGNPLGAIFGSTLITVFQSGSNYMSATMGVDREIASLIIGILLLVSACSAYIKFRAQRHLDRLSMPATSNPKKARK